MYTHRFVSAILLLALSLFGLAGQASSDNAALLRSRRGTGKIVGRLDVTAARRLLFTLDGARVRPRVVQDRFVLREVPAGPHSLSIVDPARNAGVHMPVTVKASETTRTGPLELLPGGQIAGLVSRVSDPATGALEPIAGAEVVAELEGTWEDRPRPRRRERHPQLASRLVAQTDASGAYSFRGVPAGPYRVSVVVPGLTAGVEFTYVELGRTSAVDFLLREAIEEGIGTVEGTITDASGEPLSGVVVTVYSAETYYPSAVSPISQRRAALKRRSRGATPASLPRLEFATLTNRRGRYSLNVPSGFLYLVARKEGYVPTDRQLTLHPDETLEVDAVLEEEPVLHGGAIVGAVYDGASGQPVVEARVMILVEDGGEEPPHHAMPPEEPPLQRHTAITDETGWFFLDRVPAGTWRAVAERDGYVPGTAKVTVHDGDTSSLDFVLQPRRRVSSQRQTAVLARAARL